MRRCFRLLPIIILLAGCGGAAPPGQPANAPLQTPTWQPAASDQLPLGDLLFQPGDLPAVMPGSLNFFDPATWQATHPFVGQPGQAARLSLLIPETQFISHVTAYVYRSAEERSQQFAAMLRADSDRDHAIGPQAQGLIRSVAAQSYDAAPAANDAHRLVIGHCRIIIEIFLTAPFTHEDAVAYGERIARRVQAVDCDGSATVPILPTATAVPTAPAPTATPTPAPTPTTAPLETFALTVHALSYGGSRPYGFAGLNDGWVASGALLYATADRGATWRPLAELDAPIIRIRRESPSAALVQTTLGAWRTSDGGASWRPDEEVLDLAGGPADCTWGKAQSWLDQQRGWALCGEEPVNTRTMRKRVFRTIDGGRTWELLAWTASRDQPNGTLTTWGYVNGIWFIDNLHGWLGVGIGGLLATSDGGATWGEVPRQGLPESQDDTSIRVHSPVFTSPQNGVISVENRDARPGEPESAMYVTDDGGQSWHQIIQEPPPPPVPSAGWQLLDERNGIGVDSSSGAILATSNRGASWHEQGSLQSACPAALAGVTDTVFLDAAYGWALVACAEADPASRHTLVSTADGGQTWMTAGSLNDASDPARALDVVDASAIFVLHTSGAVLASHDGGANWAVRSKLSGASMIDVANASAAWAVQNGALLRSNDGGATWAAISTGFAVQSLAALPTGELWAVGVNPDPDSRLDPRWLLRSNDAGSSWQRASLDKSYRFKLHTGGEPWPGVLSWVDPLHGWLIMPDQLFWTGDGGQTWAQMR
jgi:photosystem II stability/assembly factor-like uncharacterized protein